MKKSILLFAVVLLFGMSAIFTGCVKEYSVFVSSQDLRFGLDAESQTFTIRANCKWTITKNDDADWYTISPMSGRAKDSIVTVTVNDYSGGDFRGSSFVVKSPGGHVYRTVFVSQNKIDVYGMVNKVYGVSTVEHWNTDYYGQIIEDEYKLFPYDPYDTTSGHLMYFFEDGQGLQRNRTMADHAIWFPFEYEYDPDSSIFHIVFHLEDGGLEPYNPQVLCASDSLYRVFHEYKPHWFERADMRKIGTINPGEKALLMQNLSKRKKSEPIFITE